MKKIDPIRIHASDDAAAIRYRHAQIEGRLNELGDDQVRSMLATGGLPTGWNPIIHAWLAGDRLAPGGG
jgi:hypothetical protein